MNNRITKIVVTGGPCAGKTSAMTLLHSRLSEMGFLVVIVPESARDFIQSGLWPATIGNEGFQTELLSYILEREERFTNAALRSSSEQIVVLCDRGSMDGVAYIGRSEYEGIVQSLGRSVPQIRDSRYEAVIHLRTAALGASQYYATDEERLESPEEAIALDERTCAAWVGHPHLTVIDNSTDFETKKLRVLQAICRVLGVPVPIEIERKFLVARPDLHHIPASAQTVDIIQHYLETAGPDIERRIRKRSQDGVSVYYYTIKRPTGRPDTRIERERLIPHQTYELLLEEADTDRRPIEKKRTCFVWRNQYFELDDFSPMGNNACLLEIELTEENQEVVLPDFVTVIREVTGDPAYSNAQLARI